MFGQQLSPIKSVLLSTLPGGRIKGGVVLYGQIPSSTTPIASKDEDRSLNQAFRRLKPAESSFGPCA